MTLESTPPAYSSVNDDLVYVAYDANSIDVTKLNYKYVGEVWIGGVKVYTSKVFPHPDNNRGVFNFGTVVREYITAVLQAEMGQGVFAIDVVVKLREEYNGTTGAVILTDSTRTFFNHYNGRINDFTLLSTYANKPATSRPLTIELLTGTTTYYLPYFATTTTPFSVVINGVTTAITPTVANTIQNINIAVGATADYTVVLGGATYQVKVICEPITTPYVLHFLSQFGGFESMVFSKVHKKKFNVERKTSKQPAFRVSASGVVSVKSGSTMHDQKTNFGIRFSEKLAINTDNLTDEEFTWLAQLVFSPIVYLQDGATLYPVLITATDYEERQYIVDGLTNLTIELDFATSYKTQYR